MGYRTTGMVRSFSADAFALHQQRVSEGKEAILSKGPFWVDERQHWSSGTHYRTAQDAAFVPSVFAATVTASANVIAEPLAPETTKLRAVNLDSQETVALTLSESDYGAEQGIDQGEPGSSRFLLLPGVDLLIHCEGYAFVLIQSLAATAAVKLIQGV